MFSRCYWCHKREEYNRSEKQKSKKLNDDLVQHWQNQVVMHYYCCNKVKAVDRRDELGVPYLYCLDCIEVKKKDQIEWA